MATTDLWRAALDVVQTADQIRAVAGVTKVQPFGSVELPAGSVRLGTSPINAPVSVVAFDPTYLADFPLVHLSAGQLTPGRAVLSQPAADLPGATGPVTVTLPGQSPALTLPVSGTADFSQATQLFLSRSPDSQGDFAGSPYVLLVDLATFRQSILPAYRTDSGTPTKNPPVLEYHVAISHDLLSSDPGTAAVTTQGLRRTIERVAPGEITVTDNLTDALTTAKKDSILAKTLFIFLGLPGVLLAAYLSRYAGSLLAEAQRRERAILRARGLRPALLVRSLAYSTAAIALIGSTLGLLLGFGVLTVLFRDTQALPSSPGSYALSIGLALLAAVLTTTLALYVPGRRALLREVADERREVVAVTTPGWQRARLDLVLLAVAAIVGLITYLTGGYKPAVAAEGQSVSLSFYVLLAPVLFWIGATLLAVRGLLAVARRSAARVRPPDFGRHLAGRTLARSVLRRPQAVASGVIALSLAIAFGASLMVFIATYQTEKLADSRYVLGGDVRVTASVSATGSGPITDQLSVPGVTAVAPAASSSAVLVGSEKRTLVAIDPASFAQVAPLAPSFFLDTTPEQAMAQLAADPKAVLIDQEVAKAFNVQTGDPVKVQIPNAQTGQPTPVTLHAVGTFTNFPGFPQGVDLVTNLPTYQTAAGLNAPDFYLLATDGNDPTNAAVTAAIDHGPGRTTPVLTESTAKAVNKEQSTLAALNLAGLGRIEITFTILMSALGIAIFVFGLLLQRHKEHVTLRALGMASHDLLTLVLGEAGIVAVAALLIGLAVGLPMAVMSVQILQPVFTVPPSGITVPVTQLALLTGLVLAAVAVASGIAASSLRRAHLVEILRED
jgi:putative ABC transport system permease protein